MKLKEGIIQTKINEIFKIELVSNPTTGYKWEPIFNKNNFALVANHFKLKSKKVGGNGVEIFEFKSKKSGNLKIKMIYKRSWEKQIEKEISYNIISS